MWWGGPPMLKKTIIEDVQPAPIANENLPEMRAGVSLVVIAPVKRLTVFERTNDYDRMIRSMAYFVRFARFIISKKQTVVKGRLTAPELQTALLVTVRCIQKEAFQPELRAIVESGQSKHRLCGLKPFIDPQDGILRVGGRIKNALTSYDSRHQMLLPAGHPFTAALVRSLYLTNLHIGVCSR